MLSHTRVTSEKEEVERNDDKDEAIEELKKEFSIKSFVVVIISSYCILVLIIRAIMPLKVFHCRHPIWAMPGFTN